MIILVGFPKTGTTSFQDLFVSLGYKSIHHTTYEGKYIGSIIKKNKINNLPLLTSLDKYDCITQLDVCVSNEHCYWPQIVDYKQLYYENKNAVFILNKRNPIKLLSSFKRWHNLYERFYNYSPEIINNKTDEGFINFVENHYKNIEDFFNLEKDSKFIVYDIETDNIDKLKKYIDIKNISVFPKKNINS